MSATRRRLNAVTAAHDPGGSTATSAQSTTARPNAGPRKPKFSVRAQLFYLHTLLSAPAFKRLPLVVRPLAPDIASLWQEIVDSVDPDTRYGRETGQPKTWLDGKPVAEMDVTYSYLMSHLKKSQLFLNPKSRTNTLVKCCICRDDIVAHLADALLCPLPSCTMTAHLKCLSQRFLESEKVSERSQAIPTLPQILPRTGRCPTCKASLSWEELVRELAVRRLTTTLPPSNPKRTETREMAVQTAGNGRYDHSSQHGAGATAADEDGFISLEKYLSLSADDGFVELDKFMATTDPAAILPSLSEKPETESVRKNPKPKRRDVVTQGRDGASSHSTRQQPDPTRSSQSSASSTSGDDQECDDLEHDWWLSLMGDLDESGPVLSKGDDDDDDDDHNDGDYDDDNDDDESQSEGWGKENGDTLKTIPLSKSQSISGPGVESAQIRDSDDDSNWGGLPSDDSIMF